MFGSTPPVPGDYNASAVDEAILSELAADPSRPRTLLDRAMHVDRASFGKLQLYLTLRRTHRELRLPGFRTRGAGPDPFQRLIGTLSVLVRNLQRCALLVHLVWYLVWCGVVWCGVVWCGVVWCGVVWCGVVWCGVVWCGVVCRRRCYQKAMAGMSTHGYR